MPGTARYACVAGCPRTARSAWVAPGRDPPARALERRHLLRPFARATRGAARQRRKQCDDIARAESAVGGGLVAIHRGDKRQIVRQAQTAGDVGHGGAVREIEGRPVSLGRIGEIPLQRGEEPHLELHGQGSS